MIDEKDIRIVEEALEGIDWLGTGSSQKMADKEADRCEAAWRRICSSLEVLDLYREAVRIDVQMEGPKFMGSNLSALKRAWLADRLSKFD